MSAPSPPLVDSTRNSTTTALPQNAAAAESSSDPSTKLAEAIDDFLGDLEKKFRGISDEVLTKLDDMAERCDRLEQEMLLRENSMDQAEQGPSKAGES